MNFDIVAGGHKARVVLIFDGKGGFSGEIVSDDFGKGRIGGAATGDHLIGAAELDGHSARFDATVADGAISGTLTAGWFFSQSFSGTAAS